MKEQLTRLYKGEQLSRTEAYDVLKDISKETYNTHQVASFLTVFNMRPIAVNEVLGFRDCLLELCVPCDLTDFNTIDLCGTGGDGKHTFNVSTLAAFIVAGAGYKVAKHGNYGVSSVSGSSNVLELLGYNFTNDQDILRTQLDASGICFLHAPLFHPALKSVGPIRRELGVKTFFNIMGPLVNPSKPKHQLTGVFNLQTAALYEQVLLQADIKFSVVFGLDVFDEISLTANAKVTSNNGTQIVPPSYFNMDQIELSAISGGSTKEEAAAIFKTIIEGKGTTAQNNVVIANAALAIQCFNQSKSITTCIDEARESLTSLKALNVLKQLLAHN